MTNNAVVTPHQLSAEAGRAVMGRGGNAVDAAVAAVAAQGVVAPETCGLGGDLFALVHAPGWERPMTLNASGRAGSNVDAEELRRLGHAAVPSDHPMTVTIPGCVDGLVALSERLGDLPLSDNLEPAIELARSGFAASTEQAEIFSRMADVYRDNRAVEDLYPQGAPVEAGMLVKRPDLAETLRMVAEGGREAFYRGRPGEDIVSAVGGLITLADMDHEHADWIEPIGVSVSGLTAWTTPPNSQGYLGPASLAVFEMLDPPDDPGDPLWWHLLIEAYRALAWERNDLVSDPDSVALPADLLLDRDRLQRAAASIDPGRAGVWPTRPGTISGTAFLCTADADGLVVSVIQSNYRGTGSPFGAARSGFLLQDRGGGFTLTPGHPNELAPNRRPLHTLSPTLWTDGNRPRWTIGTRGGAVQPQLVAQVAARAVVSGWDPVSAQGAPRWTIADFGPFSEPHLSVEPGAPEGLLHWLRGAGHRLEQLAARQPGWGPVSIIELREDGLRAAADPRVDTSAALLF